MSKSENSNQRKLLLLSDTPDFEADFAENNNEIDFPNQTEIELLDKKRKINLQKLFTLEGMDLIISEIQKEVSDFSADISTKEGRAKIISMAAKVAKCKSPIKNLASELKEESRRLIDGVNAQWNRYETAMDTLRDEIRKPVDEIEEREAAILKSRQDQLRKIEDFRTAIYTSGEASKLYAASIEEVKKLFQFDWGSDWAFKAETVANEALYILGERLLAAVKYEEEQAELSRLRKEAAERAQKDHEEKIAREAAEKERKESEERERKAAEEKRVAEAKAIMAERRAQIMALGLVQDIQTGYWILPNVKKFFRIFPSELFAKDAATWEGALKNVGFDIEAAIHEQKELDEEAKVQAQKEAKAREEKAAADAVEKERLRVAEEKRLADLAAEKLAANKRHCTKINDRAASDLIVAFNYRTTIELRLTDALAILEEIAQGKVKNVQINY